MPYTLATGSLTLVHPQHQPLECRRPLLGCRIGHAAGRSESFQGSRFAKSRFAGTPSGLHIPLCNAGEIDPMLDMANKQPSPRDSALGAADE